MKIVNPATERVIKNIAADDKQGVQAKYEQAQTAFREFRNSSVTSRLEIVQSFHELLIKRKEKLASVLTSETGKPLTQSRNEVTGAADRIVYFLDNSARVLSDEPVSNQSGMREFIRYEPLGVIANISAWNYPYLVGVNVFVPAIIAGNAVLYKPSEYATLTGLEIQKLWYQAGLPADIFKVILGDGLVGADLLELPLDGYFFTGSFATGRMIYQQVAEKMVPCQLELGGKDALYVTQNNSNIRSAAAAAVEGAFYNNGQSCCAVERIYVHQQVYHDFINYFVQEVKQLKLGDPENEEVSIGPLTRKAQIAFLQDQVDDAVAKGAKVLSGGKSETRQGYYFQPTVLIDTNHQMKLMRQESFGPVIGIQQVSNDQEAITLMNDTNYGLTAAVFTEDPQQAETIMNATETGTVYWNCSDRVSPRLPWSGRKDSGFGATLSEVGIRAFVQPKAFHMRSKL